MAAALSFSPSLSISSHTLSAQSQNPMADLTVPSTSQDLIEKLSTSPHIFLQPPRDLHNAALALAKHYLDPLAGSVSDAQTQRQKEARRKRKRGEADFGPDKVLHLKKIHLDGFGVDQIWEQARKVLDAARNEVQAQLPEITQQQESLFNGQTNGFKSAHLSENVSDNESERLDSLGGEDVDWEFDGIDNDPDAVPSEEDELDNGVMKDGQPELQGLDTSEGSEDDILKGEDLDEESDAGEAGEEFVEDRFGLNDGFFSIDEFNRQSEFLEQRDAQGEDDGAASDEEEIDWDADPLNAKGLTHDKDIDEGEDVDEDEDDDEEDDEVGPTFGDMDLNAPEGASDDESIADGELDDVGALTNTNNITYADFFAPPPRKAGKNKKKRGRPNPHNFPAVETTGLAKEDDAEGDLDRTMSAVHRDLFDDADDDTGSDNGSDLTDLDPSDPKSRRSTHERRQAKLAAEIRKLEAANVAKREWTLTGEARAADRPLNSLLEEDLEFERAGKPVPVITAEVTESIEALIKRRILAREFDEVIRRRPDNLATGPDGATARRGRFELDDAKSKKGLAELYEEEHLRRTDPNFVDTRDEKLKKGHAEIEAMWRSVSAKLDALSNFHYKPKPVAANLEIRVDAPVVTMEDARPSGIGGDVGDASQLAPQEVYKPGEEKHVSEIVTKGGMPVAREELTREQKLRRRRREKERIKKAGGIPGKSAQPENKQTKDKKEVIGNLKKGGVKIIGKGGELRNVEGEETSIGSGRVRGAGSYKL